ncbi:hypothetical protein L198_00004 [Cryptococcus wingfieldii CBS 7118]|uniref:Suv3 C-terminal domain-containing protein n=1 Tax=Cryptococcus wingfieldii CBS 7118 TaxID=1295528 RepID=A0A1E3K5F1_9TREE|nr:hypothetical protein L198_00004 [Cryptococcus wingfieldii CBS 7118]ODO08281.1 hypothetical protein L198_00004 [Cryptococcus wingfieldii CBS 7118]
MGSVGGLNGKEKSCNLNTGEERKIVDPDSGLLSCTVEMLPLGGIDGEPFDLPPSTVVTDRFNKLAIADVIESYRPFLSISEIDLFSFAPLSSRDEKAKVVVRNLVDDYVTLGLCLEVSFPDRLVAQELKKKCEAALEECLQRVQGWKMKKGAVDMAGRAWEKKAEADWLGEGKGVEWVSRAEDQKTKKARIWKDVALLEEGKGVNKRLDSGK